MDFPLLMAGPILRRVEPQLVSVWAALSAPGTLRLVVWEKRVGSGAPSALIESARPRPCGSAKPLPRRGDDREIPATAGKTLQPDALYSYDLEITTADGTAHTHNSLGMLLGSTAEPRRVPLGFEDGVLPSFAPSFSRLDDLNLLYGSCRRPGHPDPDALAMVDFLIKDARARPHQLFLGGDQIYADDVMPLHMLLVVDRAVQLIGSRPDGAGLAPVEHVRLDRVLLLARPSAPSIPRPPTRRRLRTTPRPTPTCRSTGRTSPRDAGSRRRSAPRSSPARTAPATSSPSASPRRSTSRPGATPSGARR